MASDSSESLNEQADEAPRLELSEEARARLFEQVMQTWIVPEIEARQARGAVPTPFQLGFAQVVFNADAAPVVRLNEEVRGNAMIQAADPTRIWQAGEDVMIDDIAAIVDFELPEEDSNAAHITLFPHADGWSISFDATYNRARIAKHIKVAQEFVGTATDARAGGRLHSFVENAFHAAEHLARAELLPLPDERFLKSKTHRTVVSRLHWWARLGNIDQDAARLLSRLEELRQSETYLARETQLTAAEAERLHEQLVSMRDRVVAHAPQPGPSRTGRRPVAMIAARDIEAGSLVRLSDNQMP